MLTFLIRLSTKTCIPYPVPEPCQLKIPRLPRQMQTAHGGHIPHASGRIRAGRFLFSRKVSAECTIFLINKKTHQPHFELYD